MAIASGHPHVGNVGHVIRCTVKDGSGAVVVLVGPITLRFQRPNGGAAFDKTGTLVGDGSTGQATYTTLAGDLDTAGTWKVQLQDQAGPWWADVAEFTVLDNLPAA